MSLFGLTRWPYSPPPQYNPISLCSESDFILPLIVTAQNVIFWPDLIAELMVKKDGSRVLTSRLLGILTSLDILNEITNRNFGQLKTCFSTRSSMYLSEIDDILMIERSIVSGHQVVVQMRCWERF
jgi:hypothetical protein